MSIILEALKKAAHIKKRDEPANIQSQTLDSSNEITKIDFQTLSSQPRKQVKKEVIFILSIVIILVAILATITIYLLRASDKTFSVALAPNPAATQTPSAAPAQAPQERRIFPSDSFILTGIVYTDNEPMAVINGSVYTEGEYVNGALVKKITNTKVLLEKRNRIIELDVK